MIEELNNTLAGVMDEHSENEDFKSAGDLRAEILDLYLNPDSQGGDELKWNSVDFTLKPEMYLLTGIPSSGKSTWLDNVIINSIMMHSYKWAIFSPESHPVQLHFQQLLEIHTETTFSTKYGFQRPSEKQLHDAIDFLNDKIKMITPKDDDLTIESIIAKMQYQVDVNGVKAFVLDPYNEFSHTRPAGISETEYVSRFLGKIRGFINKNEAMVWIVAHPTKLRKEDHENYLGRRVNDYPPPTAYDIAGSANFYNKPDVIISVHRDKNRESNPENISSIVVQKVRRKTTGSLGTYLLSFNFNNNTYSSHV